MKEPNNHCGEVDLLSFFYIFAKRKNMILSIFFISTIIIAVVVVSAPREYVVTEILKIPTIGPNAYPVTTAQAREKIEEGVYDDKISEDVGLYPARSFKFDASSAIESDFVKVILMVKEKDLDHGIKVLNSLFAVLKSEYEPLLNLERDNIENEIYILKNIISSDELAKKKPNKKLKKKEAVDINKITIEKLDIDIKNSSIEIKKLEARKQFISNFVQLKMPVASIYTTPINKVRRIAAGGMLALALGVFLALFLEYLQKCKIVKDV